MMSLIAQAYTSHLSLPWILCVVKRYSLGSKSGNIVNSHLKQHVLKFRIAKGRNSITSYAGLTVPYLYFKNIGFIFFSAKKAPFLNFKRLVPFEVAPSTKSRKGAYIPVFSISSCLSLIC